MALHIYFTFLLISFLGFSTALPSPQINSNSVLVALLDSSHYTELSELIEKALLLETLEATVSTNNITIFAPENKAFDLDTEFKRFLLEPRNLNSLQTLLLSHVIPSHVPNPARHKSLSGDYIVVSTDDVVRADHIVRPDGVIHGIRHLLIPRSVQEDFNRRHSLATISAVLPEGSPEVDPRRHRLRKTSTVPAGSPPVLPIYEAMAPGLSLAPASAPGPDGPRGHFDGESKVKDFIQTLVLYGGYNELADILVNLTSLATEMGRLVSEGYVLTVLAPNDEAMAKLNTEQLSEPGAPERIVYYHLIPEYQTEESMYNAVRRFGKVRYDSLRLPHKVAAEEADGSVKFGQGDGAAYLFDPDIYTDGRISVQGIDGVLFPAEEIVSKIETKKKTGAKVVAQPRRGKLLEVACRMLGAFKQDFHFTSCQ